MTVLFPRQTHKLSRLTAFPQVLITAGTRIITCVSRVLHVCCTSLPRVPPVVVRGLKFWAVQNFLPRPTPFRFFSASCHVYKSTVARLKLDINANNIVCFTGDHFLTGFGRDQAVKRCVTGPSQRGSNAGFDVFFDVSLNKWLNKQSSRRWFETPVWSLWRHCYAYWLHACIS